MKNWMNFIGTLINLWPLVILFLLISALFCMRSHQTDFKNIWHILFGGWMTMVVLLIILLNNGYDANSIFSGRISLMAFIVSGVLMGVFSLSDTIKKTHLRNKDLADQDSLEYLQNLSAHDFELLISDFFESLGFRTLPSEDIQDHGVDVVVYDGKGEKWIVQCKRYRGIVGEPILRDLLGTMLHERASRAFLMTTGRISRHAKTWIEDKPITVYEGDGLLRILNALKKRG